MNKKLETVIAFVYVISFLTAVAFLITKDYQALIYILIPMIISGTTLFFKRQQ